ncbi:MAG: hypothetical protein F9K29_04210 [Hyphomicrobiaceae bacterium]|nr:MAG: hypothetical protein F9K29_04210 [Hyphomicrobiaceae bacterium]
MRLRRWISVLAVLGVLLHAGALVHHSAAMLGAALQHSALLSDLALSCHGRGGEAFEVVDLPWIPKPSDAQNGCPICSGLVSAVALASPWAAEIAAPLATAAGHFTTIGSIADLLREALPPARGPPALA